MKDLLQRLGLVNNPYVEDLQAELERLRDENMRLRLDRQRMLGAASSADRVRELADAMRSAADSTDDTWQVLADSEALRDELIDVVAEVRRAMSAAEERLLSGTPATELDRRSRDRRRTEDDNGRDHAAATNDASDAREGARRLRPVIVSIEAGDERASSKAAR